MYTALKIERWMVELFWHEELGILWKWGPCFLLYLSSCVESLQLHLVLLLPSLCCDNCSAMSIKCLLASSSSLCSIIISSTISPSLSLSK